MTVIDLAAYRNNRTALLEQDSAHWHEDAGYSHVGANRAAGVDAWARYDCGRASVHITVHGRLAHNLLMDADRVNDTVLAHICARRQPEAR